ncbi:MULTISPECIES: DMT family transporter [unclassified Rathayibacter]|uniref:DMT family transporter n=1 Tax=unclassified Rathayibacter TaxID=2609250 RepID=UPI0012FC2511|nr:MULTISPECIES: DMT family transporter [unclassified Rathayibacter]
MTRSALTGPIAMIATVATWAGFALSIRGIGGSGLTSNDVALLRFGLPLLVLAPAIPRALRSIRRESPLTLACLALGAGLPYFLTAALGGRLTSAALVGLVIPGSVPVFVALLALGLMRERPGAARLVGLGSIVVGVAVIVALTAATSIALGIAILLAAGLLWAVYTLGLRRTRLTPVSVVVTVCAPSFLLSLLAALTGALPTTLLTGSAEPSAVASFALVQGVGVGVVAALAYTVAVQHLGSGRAAAFGSLSPVVTALVALPLFGESLPPGDIVGLALVVLGVVVANAPPRGRPLRPVPDLLSARPLRPSPTRSHR